jgi:16S rRNA (guanine527-N7)-methyltransferase
MNMRSVSQLEHALAQHAIDDPREWLTCAAVERLADYCQFLWQKNQDVNLTRHTTWDQFVTRDLVDSLELANQIPDSRDVMDIGSGGGIPGIILAILRPGLRLTLAESVGKKAMALAEFRDRLGIDCRICNQRAEEILRGERFDVAVCRAVGPLDRICRWLSGRWSNVGRLLAIKGPRWESELAGARAQGLLRGIEVKKISEYRMPANDWLSVILEFRANRAPDPR